MKKIISLIIILCCFSYNLKADPDTKAFQLTTPPDLVVDNSLYNKFEFIDSRSFNDYLGFVQPTILNSYTVIIEKPSLEKQLNTVFKQITNSTAQKGTLLFQLRRLYFSSASKGHCHIRYSLYEKKEDRYYFINTLDTLISVYHLSGADKLLNTTSNAIISHIANSLTQKSSDSQSYSMIDVLNINYFEKSKLKLYGINKLEDGVYKDYESFASQTPSNYKIEPVFKDSVLVSFKASDIKTNQSVKIKDKDVYAIVINGQPYIPVYECYLPIYKRNGEYQFVSKGNIKNSTFFQTIPVKAKNARLTRNNFFAYGMDITNEVIANNTITMTIDHLNGEYIPTPENASFYYYFK